MTKIKPTILAIVAAAWLLIPTGTPDDVITFYIISQLGAEGYFIAVTILLLLMVHYHITVTKAKKTMGAFVKRIKK